MKKTIYNIVACCAAVLALSACEFEMSTGELDGFWHLERIDTIATGGVNDLSRERLYWSFQEHLLDVHDINEKCSEIIMLFDHSDGTLTVSSPCIFNHTDGDVKLEDPAPLAPYGINSLTEKFRVLYLDKGRLTLESETLRLTLKEL